jgi:hypothetical protein
MVIQDVQTYFSAVLRSRAVQAAADSPAPVIQRPSISTNRP